MGVDSDRMEFTSRPTTCGGAEETFMSFPCMSWSWTPDPDLGQMVRVEEKSETWLRTMRRSI